MEIGTVQAIARTARHRARLIDTQQPPIRNSLAPTKRARGGALEATILDAHERGRSDRVLDIYDLFDILMFPQRQTSVVDRRWRDGGCKERSSSQKIEAHSLGFHIMQGEQNWQSAFQESHRGRPAGCLRSSIFSLAYSL
jgi:hypothetical protein